jgi:hypothetical protein
MSTTSVHNGSTDHVVKRLGGDLGGLRSAFDGMLRFLVRGFLFGAKM